MRFLFLSFFLLFACHPGQITGENNVTPCAAAACADLISSCGNHSLDLGEACDDGNAQDGDCCSSTCQIESDCEVEPNDLAPEATQLIETVRAQITNGDQDFFSVLVSNGGFLSAEILGVDGVSGCGATSVGLIDSVLEVRKPDGVVLIAQNDDISSENLCSKVEEVGPLPAGHYLLKVGGFGASMFSYRLQISIANPGAECGDGVKEDSESCDDGNLHPGDGCRPDCTTAICGDGIVDIGEGEFCDDGNMESADGCSSTCETENVVYEQEDNDTNARQDFIESSVIKGTLSSSDTQDHFNIDVANNVVVFVQVFEGDTGDICNPNTIPTLSLMTDNNGFIFVSESAPDCQGLLLGRYPSREDYSYDPRLIEVRRKPNTGTYSYHIKITFLADLGVEIEDNNQISIATPIPVNSSAIGAENGSSGVDFYSFVVPDGRSLRAEVIESGSRNNWESCDGGEMNPELTLHHSSGVPVAIDDNSGRGLCPLIDGIQEPVHAGANHLAGGTYYLRVRSSQSASNQDARQFNYRLLVWYQ